MRLRLAWVVELGALVVGPRFQARHAVLDDLGVTAAAAINADLTAEETARAVAAVRA